jgi:hypothetical protein
MSWKFLVPVTAVLILSSCDKNSFQTKPQIKVKSVNSTRIAPGEDLLINLEFTDKEGDLGEGNFTLIRNRVNIKSIVQPGVNDKADTIYDRVPEFPKHSSGQMEVVLGYNAFLKEDPIDNDTLIFKLSVTDRAGNKSDTISTEKIVILSR